MSAARLQGESNSLLVLGPRGAGKTALVRRVLNTAAQNRDWRDNAVVVHLSGHIQTDDKLALRDITKQLNLENVVGDKEPCNNNAMSRRKFYLLNVF